MKAKNLPDSVESNNCGQAGVGVTVAAASLPAKALAQAGLFNEEMRYFYYQKPVKSMCDWFSLKT